MICQNRRFYTDAAFVAVRMLIGRADTADPTLVTMVLPLVLVIQEHANGTPVPAHTNTTSFADLAGLLDT